MLSNAQCQFVSTSICLLIVTDDHKACAELLYTLNQNDVVVSTASDGLVDLRLIPTKLVFDP